MKTISKFPLKITDVQSIMMQEGAKILTLQAQRDIPCIWAEVIEENKKVKRTFTTYGTGHELPEYPGEYLGTYQVKNGSGVFHLYELK